MILQHSQELCVFALTCCIATPSNQGKRKFKCVYITVKLSAVYSVSENIFSVKVPRPALSEFNTILKSLTYSLGEWKSVFLILFHGCSLLINMLAAAKINIS